MRFVDEIIECEGRSDRLEIFPFYDCHIGKRNCAEDAIRKQVREIIRRSKLANRHVRVVMGGDICDVIKPGDIRFDFNEVADWFLEGTATTIRKKLNDIAKHQVERAVEIFQSIREFTIGNIEANHDRVVRKRYNCDTHADFCKQLGIKNMTDEAIIRLRFMRRPGGSGGPKSSTVKMYLRHGYGGGRTPGVEPNKIARMMADGVAHDCDVCLTGHTHTYHPGLVEPVLYIPNKGKLPSRQLIRYRFGANPGCWLLSHIIGPGSYESAACYPTRPLMTVKIVIWPFWASKVDGCVEERPKIELRQYPII